MKDFKLNKITKEDLEFDINCFNKIYYYIDELLEKSDYFSNINDLYVYKNDLFMLKNRNEYFWVILKQYKIDLLHNKCYFYGQINYVMKDNTLYDFGDYIMFEKDNIFDYKPNLLSLKL